MSASKYCNCGRLYAPSMGPCPKCYADSIRGILQNVSGIEAIVASDIAIRQQHGIKKYGTTVDDNRLSRQQWLQHAYEEALDLAIYLRKCIKEEENGTVHRD